MHGSKLTPQEAVATVAQRVRRLEAQGLDHAHAIRLAATWYGISPELAHWCAGSPSTDDACEPVLGSPRAASARPSRRWALTAILPSIPRAAAATP